MQFSLYPLFDKNGENPVCFILFSHRFQVLQDYICLHMADSCCVIVVSKNKQTDKTTLSLLAHGRQLLCNSGIKEQANRQN